MRWSYGDDVGRWVVGSLLAAMLLIWATPGEASHEPFGIFEDWIDQTIRSDRWRGDEAFGGQEVKREVRAGLLWMRFRREGETTIGNVGRQSSLNQLNARNPTAIDQMEGDFLVLRMTVTGCAANPQPSRVRPARLVLGRFNDGSSMGLGDRTGDHFAGVSAFRDSNSTAPERVLRTQGFLSRCANATCSVSTTVSFINLPQTVFVGQRFTLRMIWDAPNNQFLFGVNNNPNVALPYTVSDINPAVVPFATVEMNHTTANCTAGPTVTDAESVVREVRTNASAVIP